MRAKSVPTHKKNDLMAEIEISNAKDAKGVEIGKTISITITGTVKEICAPREEIDYSLEGGKTRMAPGCIEMKITSMKVGE